MICNHDVESLRTILRFDFVKVIFGNFTLSAIIINIIRTHVIATNVDYYYCWLMGMVCFTMQWLYQCLDDSVLFIKLSQCIKVLLSGKQWS